MPSEKPHDKTAKIQVTVAIIGLLGVIGTALITNVDKWLPTVNNNQKVSPSNNSNHPPESGNANSAVAAKTDGSKTGDSKTGDSKTGGSKTVALMDNNLLTYDKKRGKAGRTNQAEIEDVLKGLDLKFVTINTYLNWNDYSKLDAKPDLIIIHVSAFYDKTDPKDKGNKFRTFLETAMPSLPQTQLLVYSRAFQDVTTSEVKQYASAVPNLEKRIRFFLVKVDPEGEYFNNMETGGKLRGLVKTMLELP